jgi:saccharopine dehydrogenase-like NADP-dependent oxidoreductase
MEILALGGAGAMARAALRQLVTTTDAAITVADRDVARASAVAGALGAQARALELDLTDAPRLHAALEGVDVVLNLAGPYYRFGVTVLDAAIATGTHYLDLCDDPAPTLSMLDRDDAARAAGVTAIVGMGASPGASNLLARLAADRLDSVDRIVTGWPEDPRDDLGEDRAPSAASVHWVHQCSHPITVLVGGRLTEVRPLERLRLHYPGVGDGTVTTVGHPEAVTLHRAYPGLRESRNVMVITPALHRELERTAALVADGASDHDGAAHLLRRLREVDLDGLGPAAPFGWLFAVAEGRRDGRPASVAAGLTAYPPGGMAGITGVPLAIATQLLLDGTIATVGVHPPETSVPPDAFFAALAPLCAGAPPVDELVLLS